MLFFKPQHFYLWRYSADTVIINTDFNKDVLMMSSLKLCQSEFKQSVSNFMLML